MALAWNIRRGAPARLRRPSSASFIMVIVLVTLGFYLIWPVMLLIINSFDTRPDWFVGTRTWGLDNWREAWDRPGGVLIPLRNSIMIWALVVGISFPIATLIAWTLARTNVPFSHLFEFLFWISFMMPAISVTIAWMTLLDADTGLLNVGLRALPFIDDTPFDIFSIGGIVWAHLMTNGISIKVMLMTPALRNMDAGLEEAARVSGASNIRTMLRVTLPLMISPLALVFALQLLRIFQSFETELLLGRPFGFYVYSTKIYELVRIDPPSYGQATVLASLTLMLVALIIPLQRWVITRRQYTTITGSFKPGLIDLGIWRYPVFGTILSLLLLLTIFPAATLVFGSFMTRAGLFYLSPVFTTSHWAAVWSDSLFVVALRTTLILGITAAILSPLLFSALAYILVRTRLRGRWALDAIIWASGAVPGILAGLGLLWLFLGPFPFGPLSNLRPLLFLYGTLWALLLVVIVQGNTSGVNILKVVFIQVGNDMEEAARISGAGWVRTYFRIWIPLLMPTLVLVAIMNFVYAVGATSAIILIASRGTMTLSLMALEYASPSIGLREEASIISLFIMAITIALASVARIYAVRMSVRQDIRATGTPRAAGAQPLIVGPRA